MKRFSLKLAIGLLALAVTTTSSFAQRGGRLHYSTLYNPQTVTAVSGEVVRVDYPPAGSGTDYCTHALLKTPEGNITAILAPKAFMDEQGLGIAVQDRVTVAGSQISIINKPFILAREVTGDRTMQLREPSGRPVWAEGDDWHVR